MMEARKIEQVPESRFRTSKIQMAFREKPKTVL